MVCAIGKLHPGATQKFIEAWAGQFGCEGYGWHVAAGAQGFCRRKGATERSVIISRIIACKAVRRVCQQALRMDKALLQRKSVDHGLEGGAGGAPRASAVHLPFDGFVEKVGGSSQRADFHTGPVQQEGRAVGEAVGAVPRCKAGELALYAALGRGVQRCAQYVCAGALQQFGAEMRRDKGHVLRAVNAQGSGFLFVEPRFVEPAHGLAEGLVVAGRSAAGGVLRHQHESGAFRRGKLGSCFVKIAHRRRAQTLHIAAVRCKVEVGLEDFFLAEVPFQLQGQQHLPQLCPHFPGFQPVCQAGHLHGDGGAAHAAASRYYACGSAEERKGIDAGVIPEKSVLVAKNGVHGSRGNIRQPCADAVFLIGGKADPHDAAAFVQHHAREFHTRQRVRAGCKGQPEQQGRQRQSQQACRNCQTPSAPQQGAESVWHMGSPVPHKRQSHAETGQKLIRQ